MFEKSQKGIFIVFYVRTFPMMSQVDVPKKLKIWQCALAGVAFY